MDRVSEGGNVKVQSPIHICVSPITGDYRLPGTVNGIHVTLLLDTGAAVTLLRHDTWTRAATQSSDLTPWSGASLVSAAGTALTIHGCACVNLELGGKKFQTNVVVVSLLTSEAILGLDFLQAQQATIDLGHKTLHLRESGCNIPLDVPTPIQSCSGNQQIRPINTVEVPPRSMMEVPAYFETAVSGVWLVEGAANKCSQVAIARAIVQPTSTIIPVCVLNVSEEPVTLYAGAVIATMQHIELPAEVGVVTNDVAPEIDDEKQQKLRKLAEGCSTELSPGEHDIFYNLLLKYADVMASSVSDLGRTDRLRHRIDTGSSPPVRQSVRRISPGRREELKELLSQMLKRGVIELSSSPWASPVVLVRRLHKILCRLQKTESSNPKRCLPPATHP